MNVLQWAPSPKAFVTLIALIFCQASSWSQQSTGSKTVAVNASQTPWFAQPWVLVIGGVVLIVLLILFLRSGSPQKTRVTKTVAAPSSPVNN